MATRVIRIPIVEIVGEGSRQEFMKELRKALKLSVQATNLAYQAFFVTDTGLGHGKRMDKKLLYRNGYAAASEVFPSGCSQSLSALVSRAMDRYKTIRSQIASGRASTPTAKSSPWPVKHNKSSNHFELKEQSGGAIVAKVKMLAKWWEVRLRGGSNYRDQLRGLRKAIEMDSYGDSSIWIDRRGSAVIGVCVQVSPIERPRTGETLLVATSQSHLLTASMPRSPVPFVITGDEARKWDEERFRRLQRLRQDRKAGAPRRRLREQFAAISHKNRHRLQSLCHRVTRQMVDYAVRQGADEIIYDDTVKSFLKTFPWYQMKSMLKYKCQGAGLRFLDKEPVDRSWQDIDEPHVYFKYSPGMHRVKIGETGVGKGRHNQWPTDSADDSLVVVAIENVALSKRKAREKHWHAYFAECRIMSNGQRREWFEATPVLAWLREAGWLGNAGNLSEIAQVLDVSDLASSYGHLQADGECLNGHGSRQVLAERGLSVGDISTCGAAPEVTESIFGD